MKVLVVGSGGREHTLVWKLAQSPKVTKLYCAPGNAGIAQQAECVQIAQDAIDELIAFVKKEAIDFTVVGPEQPLVEGIADRFQSAGLKIFAPSKRAAELEGSKIFAKQFMSKYGVPTASYQIFSDSQKAIQSIEQVPIVVKADGLAAGKGVVVAGTKQEAIDAIQQMIEKKAFGASGEKIIIEECLQGNEISVLAFVDGKTILPLASSQDHKRIFEDDEGPNTGGMGAISPSPLMNPVLAKKIQEQIFRPILKGIQEEGLDYHGILYIGLMVDAQGDPYVLEFNVRFGDPETQAVLVRLDSDLLEAMEATTNEKLASLQMKWKPDPAVCVVMASGGYPGNYEKKKPIQGLAEAAKLEKTVVFHAGTALQDGKIVTAGGRVLGVTAWDKNFENALSRVYAAVRTITFDQAFFRKDIGKKALAYLSS